MLLQVYDAGVVHVCSDTCKLPLYSSPTLSQGPRQGLKYSAERSVCHH